MTRNVLAATIGDCCAISGQAAASISASASPAVRRRATVIAQNRVWTENRNRSTTS